MDNRIVIRSDMDNHVLFTAYKAYYPTAEIGEQIYTDHKHAELEISCILSGEGIYNCNSTDYPFSPGDVFLHCGNDAHYFRVLSSPESPSLIALRFEPRFIWSSGSQWFDSRYLNIFMAPNQINRCIPHQEDVAQTIRTLLEEIFQECHDHKPSYDLLVKAKLMTILANMTRYFHLQLSQKPQPLIRTSQLAQMEESMNYILGHLNEPLSLDMLAKKAAMSRSYYSTLFKTLNGVSVWDYVTHLRIDLALYQLEQTDDPITKICESCGYNNISNFNRMFKRVTGKTPREYRASAAQYSPVLRT